MQQKAWLLRNKAALWLKNPALLQKNPALFPFFPVGGLLCGCWIPVLWTFLSGVFAMILKLWTFLCLETKIPGLNTAPGKFACWSKLLNYHIQIYSIWRK